MTSVHLIEKPARVIGASVSDLLYLFKYHAKGLPEWVIRAHNEGKLLFTDATITLKTADFNQTVDHRWWLLQHPNGVLQAMREDHVWDKYNEEVN